MVGLRVRATGGKGDAGRPGRACQARLLGVAQLAAALLVVGYGYAQPLRPDGGLRRIDAPTLHDRVPGLDATGRGRLVVATGAVAGDAGARCRAAAGRALADRAAGRGIPGRYDLVLLVTGGPVGPGETADLRGDLTRALHLERALVGCHPGYVVVSGDGVVRYQTYDDGWVSHASEQAVLLGAG